MAKRKLFETEHYLNLTQNHELTLARKVNIEHLRQHLIVDHNVPVREAHTRGELGKLHLVTHAIIASPQLRQVLDLPENFGTGRHIPEDH